MALYRNLIKKIYDIKAHDGKVNCLNLGETGRVIASGGDDSNVNLWAIGQDKCFMSLTGHNRSIEYVRFDYNDDFVYSTDDIGIIRRWDLNAQKINFTLNGHMKSVRSLDFNPTREYVVSGSDDTTVRLWDVRSTQKCVKTYRAHISAVNSVKFSPDGLWIASAGSEGCIRIWDIRSCKQIKCFVGDSSAGAVTCIQYHPFEFLLAAGYRNGSMRIFDLESNSCISSSNTAKTYIENPISCITFSYNGRCIFTGSPAGVSVLGWEPDREFDNIKSNWKNLADMKIVNQKLICGCYEGDWISVNAAKVDNIIPFFDPSTHAAPLHRTDSTRRKFSDRQVKISDPNRLSGVLTATCDNPNGLPIELGALLNFGIESNIVNIQQTSPLDKYTDATANVFSSSSDLTGDYASNGMDSCPGSLNSNIASSGDNVSVFSNICRRACSDDDEIIKTQSLNPIFNVNSTVFDDISLSINSTSVKSTLFSSASVMDLNNVDVKKTQSITNFATQRSTNTNTSVSRITQPRRDLIGSKSSAKEMGCFSQPTRSKTLIDMSNRRRINATEKKYAYMNFGTEELQMVSAAHARVIQELTRRHAGLSMLRELIRSQDPVGALKRALSMSQQSVFVDLLGAILERPASWNLDLCVTLLPEIYKLLQSEHKFYFTRACETLRIILNDFQPIIHENLTNTAINGLGVDLTREERHRKCVECQRWLLRIRNLHQVAHSLSNFSNLQKMIIT